MNRMIINMDLTYRRIVLAAASVAIVVTILFLIAPFVFFNSHEAAGKSSSSSSKSNRAQITSNGANQTPQPIILPHRSGNGGPSGRSPSDRAQFEQCDQLWSAFRDESCIRHMSHVGLQNYATAQAICAEAGARVISITDDAEQSWLEHFLFNRSNVVDNVWLRNDILMVVTNNDNDKDNHRHGNDSEHRTAYTNWAAGRPKYRNNGTNVGKKEDERKCVLMHSDIDSIGRWFDVRCDKKAEVVCQRRQATSIEQLQAIVFEQRQMIDRMWRKISIKSDSLSCQNSIPIGFVYVQFPDQVTPYELWNRVSPPMRWEDISNQYAGYFFRAAGGAAAPFGLVQAEASPRLTQVTIDSKRDPPYYGNVFQIRQPQNNREQEYQQISIVPGQTSEKLFLNYENSGEQKLYMRFNMSAEEVCPQNMAIRVWRRVA